MATEPTPEFIASRERIATVALHALLTSSYSQEMIQAEQAASITERAVQIAEALLRELEL